FSIENFSLQRIKPEAKHVKPEEDSRRKIVIHDPVALLDENYLPLVDYDLSEKEGCFGRAAEQSRVRMNFTRILDNIPQDISDQADVGESMYDLQNMRGGEQAPRAELRTRNYVVMARQLGALRTFACRIRLNDHPAETKAAPCPAVHELKYSSDTLTRRPKRKSPVSCNGIFIFIARKRLQYCTCALPESSVTLVSVLAEEYKVAKYFHVFSLFVTIDYIVHCFVSSLYVRQSTSMLTEDKKNGEYVHLQEEKASDVEIRITFMNIQHLHYDCPTLIIRNFILNCKIRGTIGSLSVAEMRKLSAKGLKGREGRKTIELNKSVKL
ncbi:hypothetical protein C0J52_26682, partial [Blattella germanica]